MTYYPINTNVPLATNNPVNDVTPTRTNFSNLNGYLQVDHTNPDSTTAGFHKQVTFNLLQTAPAPATPQSVLYTGAGVADTTDPQLYWTNSQMTIPVSPVKAWGRYTVSGGVATSVQNTNVSSVTKTSAGIFSVVLATGATSTSSYGIICTVGAAAYFDNYTITGTSTFSMTFRATGGGLLDPVDFTFLVLQI